MEGTPVPVGVPAPGLGALGPGGRARRWEGLWARVDSPALPAAVMAMAAALVVGLRLLVAAHGDPTWFIQAGREWVDPRLVPVHVRVFPGSGYDGQFYFRLALDPADLGRRALGITFDGAFRAQRIGYPALAWLVAGGQAAAVPVALIVVNVAALAALGFLGGMVARLEGRHAAWGLLVAGFFGLVTSLARDLTEPMADALVVGGLVALRRGRPVLAGLALSAAVLTKDPAVLVVLAVGLVRLVGWARRRARPGLEDLAWIMPGVAFVAWELVLLAVTGGLAGSGAAASNLTAPFRALVAATSHYLRALPGLAADIWVAELAVLAVMAAYTVSALGSTRAPFRERLAWVLVALLLVSLSSGVWRGEVDFRSLDLVPVLGAMVLLGSRRRLVPLAVLLGLAWAVVAVHRVLFA